MPLYPYVCKCGNEWESANTVANRNKEVCTCGKTVNVSFKGLVPKVDNFFKYYDQQLGCYVTSAHERRRLMKKQGVHYAEDNPKNRELFKQAKYLRGASSKEMQKVAQSTARKDLHSRIDKTTEKLQKELLCRR